VRRFRACYDEYANSLAKELQSIPPRKQYLYFSETHAFLPWAYELATQAQVLDAVASILGRDLMIWDSRWFVKPARSATFVSWHQDGVYFRLNPPNVATAWIALSPSTRENGCMQVVPGSHRGQMLPHQDTDCEANALARGQEILIDVDPQSVVPLELQPGEISIHHVGTVHGSLPNESDEPRIGLAVRFITPDVVQNVQHSYAMLVRGSDRFGHFERFEVPTGRDRATIDALRGAVVNKIYANLLETE
jgi:ectoine hydroxylase-related dioxygenase (phytanoyl-CoA dioxygenase family)